MNSNRKPNKQLYFILNQNQIHINNNITLQSQSSKNLFNQNKTSSNLHQKQEEKKAKISSSNQRINTDENEHKTNNYSLIRKKKQTERKKQENNHSNNEDIQSKYYFRLQKLLDTQSSRNNSNISSSNKNINLVNTFNQDSKNGSRNNSQESSFRNNLTNSKQFLLKNQQEVISLKNLSNNNQDFQNQFGQDEQKKKGNQKLLKNIVTSNNSNKESKNQQINQIKKILDLSNDKDQIMKTQINKQQLNSNEHQQQNEQQQQQNSRTTQQPSSTNRFMTRSDIQQLEDYVNDKMNFGLIDKQKYQKDVLNDRENEIEILKTMRDFTYFQNTQSTLDFKNRFNIGKIIGQGAYAQVREAYDNQLEKKVAIKIYKKEKLREGQRLRGIRREVGILALLKKVDNVGGIIDLVETRNHINIVMEYCEGRDIYSSMKMKFNRRLDEREAQNIFYQLIMGLDKIHQGGIAHRDIKLENILIDIKTHHDINCKIIDFGFSTCQLKNQKNRIFCGTPSYMAPEIVRKVYYEGFQADIWASAVVLFAMLSGDFPFRGKTDRELYNRICSVAINYPDSISQKAKELLQKMFQFDPYMRPSCKQILNDPWLKEFNQMSVLHKNGSFTSKYASNRFRNSQEQQDQFKEFIKKVGHKNSSVLKNNNIKLN